MHILKFQEKHEYRMRTWISHPILTKAAIFPEGLGTRPEGHAMVKIRCDIPLKYILKLFIKYEEGVDISWYHNEL